MEHEIENHIRGYVDETGADDNNGLLIYDCREPLLIQIIAMMLMDLIHGSFLNLICNRCFSDKRIFSVYAQTTYSFSDQMRLIMVFDILMMKLIMC